ncbi:Innexin shaking-B [Eumeta japonica]|uniref:Innexin n=1 Tax=Eumeta variegata TaxID=151549 RepID=A0A4C1TTQ0_EUMVA|nr:Innexin shaking-B [Eumeta japonica]
MFTPCQGVNPKIDSVAFRLHCGATTAALLAASAALTTRHLVGNPIDCIHTRDIPEDVLNTYCWIHSTFTVAGEAGAGLARGAYPGVRPAPAGPRRYGKYYQWVAFMLFLQVPRSLLAFEVDKALKIKVDFSSVTTFLLYHDDDVVGPLDAAQIKLPLYTLFLVQLRPLVRCLYLCFSSKCYLGAIHKLHLTLGPGGGQRNVPTRDEDQVKSFVTSNPKYGNEKRLGGLYRINHRAKTVRQRQENSKIFDEYTYLPQTHPSGR